MGSASVERRIAPRFSVRCTGELASGSCVVAVTVSDMSVTGCGIEVDDMLVEALGRTGVLSIRPAGDSSTDRHAARDRVQPPRRRRPRPPGPAVPAPEHGADAQPDRRHGRRDRALRGLRPASGRSSARPVRAYRARASPRAPARAPSRAPWTSSRPVPIIRSWRRQAGRRGIGGGIAPGRAVVSVIGRQARHRRAPQSRTVRPDAHAPGGPGAPAAAAAVLPRMPTGGTRWPT